MNKKGFSLLEVLVSTSIILVLFAVTLFASSSNVQRARDAKRKTSFEDIQSPLEIYFESAGCYPQALECGRPLELNGNKILGHLPCDPKTGLDYYYETDGTSCSSWYRLYTNLEIDTDGAIDLVDCAEGCGPSCQFNYGVSSTNTSIVTCSTGIPTSTPIPPLPTNTPVPTNTLTPIPTATDAPTATPTITPSITPTISISAPPGQPNPTGPTCSTWPPPWPWWLWWLWIIICTLIGHPPPTP